MRSLIATTTNLLGADAKSRLSAVGELVPTLVTWFILAAGAALWIVAATLA